MLVDKIDLLDFRNIEKASLEFSRSFNVITGRNAQGKTNLLEALHLFSLGRSFRTRSSAELIRFEAARFFAGVSGRSDRGVRFRLEVSQDRAGTARVRANGRKIGSIGEIIGFMPSVIFTPADIELAAGPPAARRTYIDYTAAQISPDFLSALKDYRKTLRQRNAMLRDVSAGIPVDEAQLGAWTEALARSGGAVVRGRTGLLRTVSEKASAMFAGTAGGEEFSMEYAGSCGIDADDPESGIMEALRRNRETERRRGFTAAGPHCDDITIRMGGRRLRKYGSQGRMRLAAIVMKLVQAAVIMERRGERPVVLLDDIFSELDRTVADHVGRLLSEGYQSFITSPREDELPLGSMDARLFRVKDGDFEQAGAAGG